MADWSRIEVEAIVADYLAMLELELRGQPFNKSKHRRLLSSLLNDRTRTSIEKKHQNISAILIEIGMPYISGYKPLGNYQQLLYDVVVDRVDAANQLRGVIQEEVDRPALTPEPKAPEGLESPPTPDPEERDRVRDRDYPAPRLRAPRFIDYLARESRNASLGAAGEELVVRFERARLRHTDQPHLATRVEHVSRTRGDGLGFDVLSFEPDGRERLIEVKTTSFGKQTPFFLTRNELQCSRDREQDHHLYRVFEFRKNPKIFSLDGRLDQLCRLDAMQWMARVS